MVDSANIVRAIQIQSGVCAGMGAPFSAALLEAAAADVAAGGPTAGLFGAWVAASTRTAIADAASLRWLGAMHDLALGGEVPNLTLAFPADGRPGDAAAAWRAARDAMETRQAALAAFMSHEPQTNEVRRSACLLGGFLAIGQETGLALRCFELGASAGLNQLWDRYRYRLGDVGKWGDPAAHLVLDTDWRGPPPPLDAPIRVCERAACDRKPVNLVDPLARRRLRAYIWADQLDRLARLDAATAVALAAGTTVEAADAIDWTADKAAPKSGAATVLFHSVFWQYMPAGGQTTLAATIVSLGARATPDAPFAWLRMEPPSENLAAMELRLNLWPGGEDRLLARVHPHGAWVEWA